MTLTIFTPSYNRAYILSKLYESLRDQSNYNFEWLLIDDGSSDNTRDLVRKWQQNNPFPIKYFYQENQGKHIAINNAVENSSSDLLFIVDSDDILTENAVQIIHSKSDILRSRADVAGMASTKAFINSEKRFTKDIKHDIICHTTEINYKYKITGEFAFIYKLDILKRHPYPQFSDEKFCKESLVYKRIDRKYRLLFIPEVFYKAEYRADGLSANYRDLMLNNPKSSLLFYKELSFHRIPFENKAAALREYWSYFLYMHGRTNVLKGLDGVSKINSFFIFKEWVIKTLKKRLFNL